MLTREEAEKIMNMEGESRGTPLLTDAAYVRRRSGEEGMNKIKAELERLGFPIEYDKIKAMEWVPLGLRGLSLLVIKDTFHLTEEDIEDMGNTAPKNSFILKILMRFFVSPKTALLNASRSWEKHYTVGTLELIKFHEREQYATLHLKNFIFHPVQSIYLKGYFHRYMQFLFPGKIVEVTIKKSMFQGDPYNEYKLSWRS